MHIDLDALVGMDLKRTVGAVNIDTWMDRRKPCATARRCTGADNRNW
jgi:hypothetical protein